MNRKIIGLGILYSGEYEFLILSYEEGENFKKPEHFSRSECESCTYFCARRFEIEGGVSEYRGPTWITVFGGGFIRWFPKEEYFDVEFPE